MTDLSRRTLLCTTTAAIGLSAGCLADDASQPADDDGDDATDDDNGSPTDGSEDDPDPVGDAIEDLPDGLAEGRTLTYQSPASSEPDITVLRDAKRATEWLDERESLHNADAVATFIDATDFETSILVSLSDQAPTPCYEVVLETIAIEAGERGDSDSSAGETETSGSDEHSTAEDDTLVLEAAVRETADEQVCAQSITTVGRLVRVTFESEPLTTVSATIVGHDGSTYGATMGSDSGSASASSSVESEGTGSESHSSDS